VLGIGVNINVDEACFPAEIRDIAGSVNMAPCERNRFVAILIHRIQAVYEKISRGASIIEEYRNRSIILGKTILIIRGDEQKEAIAVDIGDDGSLRVRFGNGEEEVLRSGEVSIRAEL
jgi:BirA family biotin operon repressor/biotin-[acetyl-CoA-carboxylase] ligase